MIVLFVSATLVFASTHSVLADSFTMNGIHAFDTNLGTLNQVTVVLDPPILNTSTHSSSPFENLSNHAHFVNTNPVSVAGLDNYDFASTQTSFVNPSLGADHFHTVNLTTLVKNYSGSQLNWFLNPSSPSVNTLNFSGTLTSTNEGHNHVLNPFVVVPRTTYIFTPNVVPEPSSGLVLLTVSGLMALRRRRG